MFANRVSHRQACSDLRTLKSSVSSSRSTAADRNGLGWPLSRVSEEGSAHAITAALPSAACLHDVPSGQDSSDERPAQVIELRPDLKTDHCLPSI